MKPKLYIASCSFGKDSIATILLALENNEPLDRVVFAEVMFDHEKGISGEIPEHIQWVYDTAIPKLESMGVKVDVVKDKQDYKSFFTNAVGGVNSKAFSTASQSEGNALLIGTARFALSSHIISNSKVMRLCNMSE